MYLLILYIHIYIYIYIIYIYVVGRRWALKIKEWKELSGFIDFDELYYRAQFRWAGHIARLPSWRGESHIHSVLQYRSVRWLRRQTAQYGNQGHDKRFRVWRWEQQMTKQFGVDWMEVALDKNAWEEQIIEGARRRKRDLI